MIRNKRLKERVICANYPITLLTMQPMKTKMSMDYFNSTIEYDNGQKYINDDFYKRISTIKEP
jgi:hypothetical protein